MPAIAPTFNACSCVAPRAYASVSCLQRHGRWWSDRCPLPSLLAPLPSSGGAGQEVENGHAGLIQEATGIANTFANRIIERLAVMFSDTVPLMVSDTTVGANHGLFGSTSLPQCGGAMRIQRTKTGKGEVISEAAEAVTGTFLQTLPRPAQQASFCACSVQAA